MMEDISPELAEGLFSLSIVGNERISAASLTECSELKRIPLCGTLRIAAGSHINGWDASVSVQSPLSGGSEAFYFYAGFSQGYFMEQNRPKLCNSAPKWTTSVSYLGLRTYL
ncbi:hypothetical protein NPIL_316261 [Nephila pilipes]|uniref:Uncharacterized protein n=1 Tax=Nephila pilipes TaxID=299642 RepID=A0A8X6NGD8_NEPPI|nr:hypothetical protein NPIL_316261 [Nephila pilipes]